MGNRRCAPPQITPGTLYFTTDTGKIFLDLEDGTRKSFIPDGVVSGIPVPVTEGGTGASDVTSARRNLQVPTNQHDLTTNPDNIIESGFYRLANQEGGRIPGANL